MSKLEALVEIIQSRPVLTRKDLARRYGKDVSTICRWASANKLPPAIYLHGSRIPQWRPCDIYDFERRGKLKPCEQKS